MSINLITLDITICSTVSRLIFCQGNLSNQNFVTSEVVIDFVISESSSVTLTPNEEKISLSACFHSLSVSIITPSISNMTAFRVVFILILFSLSFDLCCAIEISNNQVIHFIFFILCQDMRIGKNFITNKFIFFYKVYFDSLVSVS